ncbi:Uncharacterised protein [Salmonella enterica subsp. enterica]|nr:Uncharacterised protein [Salmonella enterica subsp. enterica] [Salmonella enterica subsp. enterica serovar Menston]
MAHSYPTAHPGDQTPAMRVGVCHDRQRFYFAKRHRRPSSPTGTVGLLFSSMIFRFQDIHIGTGFIDRFCGVVKFIQVFHVHIFNAEFMQSADAQMIQPLRPDTFIQQVIAGAVSRQKAAGQEYRCRLPAGRPAPENPRHFLPLATRCRNN